ncbi:hypothetical protein [Vibrio cortegadensis]|uniref:Uncharacterized protein n=1 Tax=Vibrio cortegadensis TaxID=1328770 RepID=A0ABV4M814_9VIBR
METIVYQITGDDLEQLIEAVYFAVVILFLVFRVGGYLIELIDRLFAPKRVLQLEEKRNLLIAEVISLKREKASLTKG